MNSLELLKSGAPQVWVNEGMGRAEATLPKLRFTYDDILEAEARLRRFAPLIAELFPETQEAGGIIESPLTETKKLKKALGAKVKGRLFVKRDSELPIAGSVKARGGIYEVLKHTEDLLGEAVFSMSVKEIRERLAGYTVQVGSTGNLGLSIGIMSAALGYRAIVHMSSDAKEWKKNLLRERGVTVVEYDGDYSSAVKQGRDASDADPLSYFVDDENSVPLFMGYAVAALRLKEQLDAQGVKVDPEHPLCVYLPCGVGGAPGGICFGLKYVFGDSVNCWFVEPTEAPCMLAAFLMGKPVPVTELGLSGRTEADGLAVGTASALVYDTVKELVSGEITVPDEHLAFYQNILYKNERIFIEPSSGTSLAFMYEDGVPDGKNYTHIAWATGGRLVPESERRKQIYTEVAAGLIWRGDKFLIAKRPPHKARGGLWEFVGGKLEEGETGKQALLRECREELGVVLNVYDEFAGLVYHYPDITVSITIYNAEIASGEPQLLEHSELKWILPSEIPDHSFCPADEQILAAISSPREVFKKMILGQRDEKYGDFQRGLVPTADEKSIVGVRMPELRSMARAYHGKYFTRKFMEALPHELYEENLLHALLLCEERDCGELMKGLDAFLPYVDNWAVCDALRPKVFKKNTDKLWEKIPEYLTSGHEFTVRFGIEMLMTHFLGGERAGEAMERVYAVKRGEYYVRMAQAWFFAEAAAKNWDEARPYLEKGFGDRELDGMTLRKCLDSFRVSQEKKEQLRLWNKNNILAKGAK